jgi:acetylornithine deacetylase/succinyl-diaminopimelate desuccinylase-like protein
MGFESIRRRRRGAGRARAGLVLIALAAAAAAGISSSGGAAGGGRASRQAFDTGRAFALVRRQLAYGPRPAGSAAQRSVAEVLRRMLPGAKFEPVPGGLRNIVGGLPGREPAIVLGAHYDTTPVPGYLGANNSAAGVAAVIEIARDLRSDPVRRGQAAVRFVLFDGEEAPAGFTDFLSQGLRGSRAYVSAHPGQTREMVLLDFIALHGELLPREAGSDPALWQRLRAAGRSVGAGALFPAATRPQILDDHTSFAQAGVPAIDLIDFDYPCWQKVCDDLSQVSRASLGAVGTSVLSLLRGERARVS